MPSLTPVPPQVTGVIANAPGESCESVTLTSVPATAVSNGEFENFAVLAQKLFQVPKAETHT